MGTAIPCRESDLERLANRPGNRETETRDRTTRGRMLPPKGLPTDRSRTCVCLKKRAREKNKPITKHVCCIARFRTTIRFIKLLPLWQHHTPPSRPPPSVFLRIFRKLQHCGIKAKGPDLCALPSHINSRESIRIAYRIVSRRCASKVCARERKTIATADPHHHPSPFTHLHGRKNICGPIASPRWRCRRNTNAAVAAAVAAGRRVKEKHLKQLHTAAPI